MHSDGKVLIEAKGGIVIDSAQSKMELKGSEISLKTTSGVKIDGGTVGVDVTTQGQLSFKGSTAKLEGQGTAEVQVVRNATVQGSMVKIN